MRGRKPGRSLRLAVSLRAVVAAVAILPCLLALQIVGQSARAATVPVVTGVSPDTGPAIGSTPVTITGSGFTGATEVDFGPVPVFGSIPAISFTVVSDTEITATFDQNGDFAGTTDVTVTTPDGTSATSAADQITFVLPPTVTSVSPDNGPATGGNTITLTGTGFTGATRVLFDTDANDSIDAASFTVDSDTQITAVVPASPSGGGVFAQVLVATPFGNSFNSIQPTYEWNPLPTVTSTIPNTGVNIGGEQVTLTGTGFTGASAVTFGSTPATSFTVVSDTKITAIAPAVALTQTFPSGVPHNMLDITVTTPNGTSADAVGAQFDYLQTPTITGVSPASGPTVGGNTVTITGTGFEFSRILEVRGLAFGSTPATSFTVNSATQITATVPPGAVGTVDITMTALGNVAVPTSAADRYVYHPTCTTTITGTNSSKITVSSGLTCLVDATQTGQVTVKAGAALSVTDSTINGAVTATGSAGITYCGSSETGNLTVTGATGPVVLSGALPDGTACGADTISGVVTITGASAPVTLTGLNQHGTLTLENDAAGVDLDGGQLNGPVSVSDNTATAPAAITVSGTTVTGSLTCTGNNPAPTDAGILNTVSTATAPDQCTALEER